MKSSNLRQSTFLSSILFLFCLMNTGYSVPLSNTQDMVISVGAQYEQDSNVFANQGEEEDSVIASNLQLGLSSNSGLISSTFAGGVSVGRFDEYDSQDYENFNVAAGIAYPNIDEESMSFGLDAGYDERSTAVAEEGTRMEMNYITIGGYIEIPYSEKFGAAIRANHEIREAKTTGFEDQTVTSFTGEWNYIYSEKLDFIGSYRYRPTSVDNTDLESTDHAIFFGASGILSGKVTGDIALGIQKRVYDGNEFDDQTSPYASLSLQWLAGDKTTIEINGSNDFDSTGSGISSEVLSFGFNLVQDLSTQFSASAGVRYLDGTYDRVDSSRSDQELLFDIRLDYIFADSGSVYLQGMFSDRSSDESYFEYKRNRFSVGVDYSF